MKKIICISFILTLILACFTAVADESRVFIFCNPETPVNVRRSPKTGTKISGQLDFGDEVITDGVIRNGFLHIYGITEDGEGWIFAGYTVMDQPVKLDKAWANVAASGRVMSYRWINGKKNKWVKVGTDIRVYAMSEEWAVTDRGYIRAEYLEVWYE